MPTLLNGVPKAALVEEVRGLLSASVGPEGRLSIGVEVELIPLRSADRSRVPLGTRGGEPGLLSLLRTAGTSPGWREEPSASGTSRFRIPELGFVTFEPGGQLELATRPFTNIDDLVQQVETALRGIFEAGDALGITLVTRGMDPVNAAEDANLLVTSDRYRKQSAHYESIGPWGRRMMRQSAAIHVNVDLGGRPVRRWRRDGVRRGEGRP